MKVSLRTFYCPSCRKPTRLFLPTDQHNCGYCGKSLLFLYREGDFVDTDDSEVISNWLKVTRTRYYGLGKPASA